MAAKLLISIISRAVEPRSFIGKAKSAQRAPFPCISRENIWSLLATSTWTASGLGLSPE
jgi:hypothetical protein